jgi:hypothetical protein
LNNVTSLRATYTYYQGETNNSTFTNPPLIIHSLVTHPGTASSAANSLAAASRYDIRFQFGDAELVRLLGGNRNGFLNYSVGTRYAHSDQFFSAIQPIGPGLTQVASRITFDGVGPRVGLQGERRVRNRGLFAYGNTHASVLVGEFGTNYRQFNNFSLLQTGTGWRDSRTVPILEYELGAGWQNSTGRFRVSGGYYFAAWFNTITTPEYIQAVQTSNYVDLEDTITFDGFTTRVELRY